MSSTPQQVQAGRSHLSSADTEDITRGRRLLLSIEFSSSPIYADQIVASISGLVQERSQQANTDSMAQARELKLIM